MQRNNGNPSFFDSKTILAAASFALIFYGWQTYLSKKYPEYGKSQQTQSAPATVVVTEGEKVNTGSEDALNQAVKASRPAEGGAEQFLHFENEAVSFIVSSYGLGLKNFTLKSYQDKQNNNIKLGVSDAAGLFEFRLNENVAPVQFELNQIKPGHFLGVARVGETTVERELIFNKENSSFISNITIKNANESFLKGFSILVPETIQAKQSASIFFPSYEHQDFLVIHDAGKVDTLNFSSSKESISKEFGGASILSVGSQYFASVVLDKSEVIPTIKLSSSVNEKQAQGIISYKPTQIKPELKFSTVLYAGPKSIDTLKNVDPELANIIDFGFFGFIARPLLYVMKAFNSLVGNWGLSIILLTLLVRLVVLPFNIMSFKSMKAMQKVQPIINSLREKHKDDPMRLNQEMMTVMKSNGANPLGGCLPMLLQIPIFFALYRVIGSSIELYSSPFYGWIHDLSAHDPFYILPVMMSVFMFIQQKLTPSTMDPAQAKIMAFMPVVFSLFMLQLPSGLTLYMVVSTLFGIIQQYVIMRDSAPAVKIKKA